MRRRTVARAAVVGGAAYYAGKKGAQRGSEQAYEEAQYEQAPPPAPPPPAAPAPAQADVTTQLEQLADLKERGILTEEEFQAKKRQILGI